MFWLPISLLCIKSMVDTVSCRILALLSFHKATELSLRVSILSCLFVVYFVWQLKTSEILLCLMFFLNVASVLLDFHRDILIH
jgi:hypothetical protein